MLELLRKMLKVSYPIDRKSARTCLLLNVAAWPGLGSVLAERFSGWLQMILSLGGLLMVASSLFQFMTMLWEETRYPTMQDRFVRVAICGALAFAAAWVWSLITSLSVCSKAVPTLPRDPAKPPAL
ncbi:MAG TPA: hypothetical protein VGH19_08975 [Verrucomicrobiae bacterium]